jgi:hypothetical protein
LGLHCFAQKPPCTSQIKFKGIMAPMVPKFGLTLRKGVDGTAGAMAGSPMAAKHKKMAGEYKISNNFGAMLRCNSAPGKGNKLVRADVALAPLNVGRAADVAKTLDPMAPLNVRRPVDMEKAADLIPSDKNNGLLDLETALAAKPTAKPIVAPPPYEGQDLDINRRNSLDGLNRLNNLQGALA